MTFKDTPDHFSKRGAGNPETSAEVFIPPSSDEGRIDAGEQEPRKISTGDVVTVVSSGKEIRVLITNDTSNLTLAVGGNNDTARKAKFLGIDLVNPIYPARNPMRPGVERSLTLAAQLVGQVEGVEIALETGAKVIIKKIESLKELLAQVVDEPLQ